MGPDAPKLGGIRPEDATTIKEVGIHLGYLASGMQALVDGQNKVGEKIEKLRDIHPTRDEFEDLAEAVGRRVPTETFSTLDKYVREKTVSKDEFEPIKTIVNRVTMVTILAVVVAVISLVVVSAN